MSPRFVRLLAALALAPLAFSCRGCGERGPQTILAMAPADAGGVFLVHDLGRAVEDLEAFATRATRKAGGAALRRTRDGFVQQLGFDPLDPAGYKKLGLKLEDGLLVFTEGTRPEPLLAVGVDDRTRFDTALKQLVKTIDGADKLQTTKVGNFEVQSAGRPFGTEVAPAIFWAHVGGFALVARGDGKESIDAALDRLGKEPSKDAVIPSLAGDALYQKLTAKVAAGDALLFARGSAATALLDARAAGLSEGAATSIDVGAAGVSSDTFLQLTLPGLKEALGGDAPLELAQDVEGDAVLVGLTRHARKDSLEVLKAQPAAASLIAQALTPLGQATGLDPEADVVPLLAGPMTASVHVMDLARLPETLSRTRSLMALLDFVHVVITAEIKDPAAMQAALDRSIGALKERGVTIEKKSVKQGEATAVLYGPKGTNRLGWGLLGNKYVYAAGPGRLERAIAALGNKDGSVLPKLKGGVGESLAAQPGTSALVLRGGALADAASGLNLGGAAAMGAAAIVGGAVELVRTLGDVGLSLSAEPDGLRLKAKESLQ